MGTSFVGVDTTVRGIYISRYLHGYICCWDLATFLAAVAEVFTGRPATPLENYRGFQPPSSLLILDFNPIRQSHSLCSLLLCEHEQLDHARAKGTRAYV